MKLCQENHEAIAFDSDRCPVCGAKARILELDDTVRRLLSELDDDPVEQTPPA